MAPSSYLAARTLDVRHVVDPRTSARDVEHLTLLLRRLATTAMGKRLLDVALSNRLTMCFASGLTLWNPGRGIAVAQYRTRERRILIGRRRDPDHQLLALAHELQHFCDEVLGWGEGGTLDSEVRAHQSDGLVAIELGLTTQSNAVGGHGMLLSRDLLAVRLGSSRFYSGLPRECRRRDGRLHPLVVVDELRSGRLNTGLTAPAAPILIAGPSQLAPVGSPADTGWSASSLGA